MNHETKFGWRTIAVVPVLLAIIASTVILNPFSSGAKNTMSTPTIACGGSTQTSINIVVTAGATGAPAGFSLQWMTAADFAANGYQWYDSDDTRLCKASFSGNANLSRYNLDPNEAVTVNVGDFLFDNGASSNCPDALTCGTDYVFRAFAHATNSLNRSNFTGDVTCSTLPCDHDTGGCTFTIGYWKTHGPVPTGNNQNEWPPSVMSGGMNVGTIHYTASQLLSIMNTQSTGGNTINALAHQLIGAQLNIANGASTTPQVAQAIIDANNLIGSRMCPPIGTGSLSGSQTGTLTTILTNYNEGGTGPGHCQ